MPNHIEMLALNIILALICRIRQHLFRICRNKQFEDISFHIFRKSPGPREPGIWLLEVENKDSSSYLDDSEKTWDIKNNHKSSFLFLFNQYDDLIALNSGRSISDSLP